MALLAGWDKRIKLDIDYTNKIGASVTWFPVTIFLKDANGDSTKVFTEITTNSRKIAITKADGTTELKGEIELWSYDAGTPANSVAIIHTSATGWTIDDDMSVYLYYDNDHAVNDNIGIVPGSSPASDVWDGSFKVVYHLGEDDTGTTINDSTSNDKDAAKDANADPSQDTGKIGKGQHFDIANTEKITIPTLAISGRTEVTWELWFKSDVENNTLQQLFVYNNDADNLFLRTDINAGTTNKIILFCYADAGGGWSDNTTAYTSTGWHHIVGRAKEDDFLDLFVDGVKIGTPVAIGSFIDLGNQFGDYLGKTRSGDLNYTDGIIDEFRLSLAKRSDAWIKAIYNSGNDSLLTYGSEEEVGAEVNTTNFFQMF